MLTRVFFLLITLFWLTMNILLLRREFGSDHVASSPVPVQLVWQKILTAPDSSSLVIVARGQRIGICHWITAISEEWANVSEDNLPSGMPRKVRGYRLRLEGSALVEAWTNRIRFEGSLRLARDRQWQELTARLGVRPTVWEVHSALAEQTVHLTVENEGASFERVLKFSDLESPDAWVRAVAGPQAYGWLDVVGLPEMSTKGSLVREVKWEACEDHLRIGHTDVPVYRLQTRLLDRFVVTIFVSRVGEILRVELPYDVVLKNDQLLPS
jgi:hypothetical protein